LAATAFASYVLPEASQTARLVDTVAVLLVIAGGAAHGLRLSVGASVQNAAVIVKLALLVGFLGFAATRLDDDVWRGGSVIAAPVPPAARAAAFATALVWISLSYSGFNAAVYVAEEARGGRRGVARAMLLGTVLVLVSYVLLNAVFVYAPPGERIAGEQNVAAIAAEWLGGASLAGMVRALIAVALATSVLSMMMAAPRVYAKMADDGLLPAFLKFRGAAPRQAIAAQVALAAGFVLVTTLRDLLTYLGLTLSLCAAGSVACLFLPAVRRQQRLHFVFYAAAGIYVAGTVGAAATMTANQPGQILGTLATLLLGGAMYLLARRTARA
jgi:APA family basic amino acid/polyamine antiporter